MTLIAAVLLLAADHLTDPVEIVKRLASADRRTREIARQYTFVQREEERQLDESGGVKKVETETKDISFLYGRRYERLIARDDKPLSEKEQAKEEEKFRKEVEKRKRESESEREKLSSEDQKRRDELRKMVDEIVKAYDLKLEGIESIDGRIVYRIAAEPRDSYNRRLPPYSVLKKLRGTMWIDAEEFQLVKVDAEVIETFSIGWILARASPGTRLHFEQARVNSEVWLPKLASVKLDGRLALFRKVRAEEHVTWKNFRKFQTDSRIVEAAGSQEP